MSWVHLEAHAKINLGLSVLSRRTDGYHEIDTVFQTISLSDSIRIEGPRNDVSLSVSGRDVDDGERNLAHRAGRVLRDATGCPGISIELTKRIPVAAGLGGGSADAAAVLVGANELLDIGLSRSELEAIALGIGSDVPFLVRGGTARGRGRGEELESLPALAGVWFVLATPPVAVLAPEAYQSVRIGLTGSRESITLCCSAIRNADVVGLAEALGNDLEAGVVSAYPEVAAARRELLTAGASCAIMSGSGPTVIGIAQSEEAALAIASRVDVPGLEIHVAEPIDTGCRIIGRGA
jgi:4-diphosphocytidyl-2-C-methyl-D-erythritol kinase